MNYLTKQAIFQKGSTTYYNASKFFPEKVREEVYTLYAYVRIVDDYVDASPADETSFREIVALTWKAWDGAVVEDKIVRDFVQLAKKRNFEKEWVAAFLYSMECDLSYKDYATMEELDEYIYGSAEVIGLMMARILALPKAADETARMQGKAMQFLNFIRDIAEDRNLGRIYMPAEDRIKFGILSGEWDEKQWSQLIMYELKKYYVMQKEAAKGYRYIPLRYRTSIRTAANMYVWTAQQIELDPSIVWSRKVKPSKNRIVLEYVKNLLTLR